MIAVQAGSSNVYSHDNQRARSWEVGFIGSEMQVLRQAVTFAQYCEGGCLKPQGRNCTPESYIRRVRNLIDFAHQSTPSNDAFKLRVRSLANSRLAALVLTKPGYAFSEEKRYGEEYVVADLDASESGSWARHFALLDQYESEGGGEIPIPWQFAQALGGSW